jgi:2'-5' RNA ligase
MKRTVRTFVAVELTAAIRGRAAELIAALRAVPADVKWVEPENMHLTLKFLDEVPLAEIAELCQTIERAVADIEPFEMEVRGAGAFPNAARPRTLWLGAADGQQPMIALHGKVEGALAKLGFRKEGRRFQPHLTIGRVRQTGPGVAELGELVWRYADFEAGRLKVREVVVFSSQLESAGPVYTALGRARLRGKAE